MPLLNEEFLPSLHHACVRMEQTQSASSGYDSEPKSSQNYPYLTSVSEEKEDSCLKHSIAESKQKSASGPMRLVLAMDHDDAVQQGFPTENSEVDTTTYQTPNHLAKRGSGLSQSIKNEALQNIIDDDQSWQEIKQRLQQSQMVTSIHLNQVCGSFVMKKAAKIKEERKANQSRFRKLRNLFKASD